ncbi:metalloprotease family M20D [Achlya hypogyna]|uniref:Metalloprotease family M20D n=1 Tax=Achlya hypogyna TaxID=1202772 RepID=A0A1V9Z0B4_ACHHY|nr:metalloprotease family M20D [Achlya hypogyna]
MNLFPFLRQLRRELHAHPELAFAEVRTQRTLRAVLMDEAKISAESIRTCAGTGLVVDIDAAPGATPGGSAVRCVAFRSDMDALPMSEKNSHLPYASSTPQAAHMCGHDGHMATLVGFAILLQRQRHKLPANTRVRLLFQPSEEENPGGALAMIRDGCLDGVDEVYGYHNYGFPLGNVHVKAGPVMAHEQEFTIKITGTGGHGSAPQLCVDPIMIAAQIVNALQTIVSRTLSPYDSAVLSVTQIHAGEANNVIPSSATLGGTMRDYGVGPTMRRQFEALVHGICTMHGATCQIDITEGYPAVINAPVQADIVAQVASRVATASSDGLPMMASEDVSYYLQERPGCFFFVGTKAPTDTQARDLHSDAYDFNDDALPIGVRMFLGLVEHRFGTTLYSDREFHDALHIEEKLPTGISS